MIESSMTVVVYLGGILLSIFGFGIYSGAKNQTSTERDQTIPIVGIFSVFWPIFLVVSSLMFTFLGLFTLGRNISYIFRRRK